MSRAPSELSQLVSAFTAWTGSSPDVLWRAPGRVNLLGEHLDYNGGHVLPFAIDRAVCVAARRVRAAELRLRSATYGEEVVVGLSELRSARGWTAYPCGVAWALARDLELPGADLLFTSDLPAGAGLSSSAAIEVATALALADLAGSGTEDVDARKALALAAQRAETEVAGAPVGIMDQMTSLLARDGHLLHLDTATLATEHLPLDTAGAGLVLLAVDTGHAHALNDGAYAERRRACQAAAAVLGVDHLAHVDPDRFESAARSALPQGLAGPARHVVSEEARVRAVAGALRLGRLDGLGPAMTASHRSMQHDFANSTPVMDAVVDAALAAGALGARMTGGGWGGTAVILAEVGSAPGVSDAAAATVARLAGRRPDVLIVRPSAGATRIG